MAEADTLCGKGFIVQYDTQVVAKHSESQGRGVKYGQSGNG